MSILSELVSACSKAIRDHNRNIHERPLVPFFKEPVCETQEPHAPGPISSKSQELRWYRGANREEGARPEVVAVRQSVVPIEPRAGARDVAHVRAGAPCTREIQRAFATEKPADAETREKARLGFTSRKPWRWRGGLDGTADERDSDYQDQDVDVEDDDDAKDPDYKNPGPDSDDDENEDDNDARKRKRRWKGKEKEKVTTRMKPRKVRE